jgi:hypothetical protein
VFDEKAQDLHITVQARSRLAQGELGEAGIRCSTTASPSSSREVSFNLSGSIPRSLLRGSSFFFTTSCHEISLFFNIVFGKGDVVQT